MGKRYQEPTSYRDCKCPYCGLYFSPRGLNGHIRFKHTRRNARTAFEDPVLILWQEEVAALLGGINTEEGLKKALRYFLTDYLTNAKPPKWMSGR
jgi:hypothetical protein